MKDQYVVQKYTIFTAYSTQSLFPGVHCLLVPSPGYERLLYGTDHDLPTVKTLPSNKAIDLHLHEGGRVR